MNVFNHRVHTFALNKKIKCKNSIIFKLKILLVFVCNFSNLLIFEILYSIFSWQLRYICPSLIMCLVYYMIKGKRCSID